MNKENDDCEITSVVTSKCESEGRNPEWELNTSVSELLFSAKVWWKPSKPDNIHKINHARTFYLHQFLIEKICYMKQCNFKKSASTESHFWMKFASSILKVNPEKLCKLFLFNCELSFLKINLWINFVVSLLAVLIVTFIYGIADNVNSDTLKTNTIWEGT